MCFEDQADTIPQKTQVQATESQILKKNLNVLSWNIRGILDKTSDSEVQKFLFHYDIILLTETHTNSISEKRYNNIPGYIYRDFQRKYIHPNAPGPSGGIGVYMKSELLEGIDIECTEECIVWLKLKSSHFKCIITL